METINILNNKCTLNYNINVHKGMEIMRQINITDFRQNLKEYSDLAQKESFEVVNRGRVLFVVQPPRERKREALERLVGVLEGTDLDEMNIGEERLKKLCE